MRTSFNSDKALFTSYVIKFSVSSTFETTSNRMNGTQIDSQCYTHWIMVTKWHIAHNVAYIVIRRCIPSLFIVHILNASSLVSSSSCFFFIFFLSVWRARALEALISQRIHLCLPIYCRFIDEWSQPTSNRSKWRKCIVF